MTNDELLAKLEEVEKELAATQSTVTELLQEREVSYRNICCMLPFVPSSQLGQLGIDPAHYRDNLMQILKNIDALHADAEKARRKLEFNGETP
jgi:hypothetical protein